MHSHVSPSFAIDVLRVDDGSARVQPQGELDLASSPELSQALRAEMEAGHRVILDLSGISFIDSTGLNAILIAVRDSDAGHGSLQISASLPEPVLRVVELAGVRRLLPLTSE